MSDRLLQGLRVVEFAGIVAGPLVGQFCAELGADVIKVEPPTGDPSRGWRLPEEDLNDDCCAYFSSANWGKRSIALDLGDAKDRAVADQLIDQADVVLISFRPGGAARFGLDAATLRAKHPKLIYVDITAYGPDDPRPGFDAIVQAEGGFTYLNGSPDGPPTKMPVALVDVLSAHQLKEGLLLDEVTLPKHFTMIRGEQHNRILCKPCNNVKHIFNQSIWFISALLRRCYENHRKPNQRN